jgi:hypothetical protein
LSASDVANVGHSRLDRSRLRCRLFATASQRTRLASNGVGSSTGSKIRSVVVFWLIDPLRDQPASPLIIPATAVSAHHKLDAHLGRKLRAGYDCLFGWK